MFDCTMEVVNALWYLVVFAQLSTCSYTDRRKWLKRINRIQLTNKSASAAISSTNGYVNNVKTFRLPELSISPVEISNAINGLLFNSSSQSRVRLLSPSLINLNNNEGGSDVLSGSIFSIQKRPDSLMSLADLRQQDPLGFNLLQSFLSSYLNGVEQNMQESVKYRLNDLFDRKLFDRVQIANGNASANDVQYYTDLHQRFQRSSYLRHVWRRRYKRQLKLSDSQIDQLTQFNSSRSFEEAVRTGLTFQEPIVLDPSKASEPDILTLVLESPVILSPYVLGPYILAPLVLSPHILSPAVLSPEILSPLILTPFILSPQVLSPDILGPSILSPPILSPEVLGPNILSPTVLSPCVLSPIVLGGDILSPSALSPFILCPAVLSVELLSPTVLSEKILSGGRVGDEGTREAETNGIATEPSETTTTEASTNGHVNETSNIPTTTLISSTSPTTTFAFNVTDMMGNYTFVNSTSDFNDTLLQLAIKFDN